MILIGTRNVLIASVKTSAGICPHCKHQFTLVYKIYRKHVRFFFIPTFTFFKRGHAKCSNCETRFGEKEMPEAIRKEFNKAKKEARGPLWQFTSLVLFVMLIFWLRQDIKDDHIRDQNLINHPMVNDVYRVKVKHKTVTFWKVREVSSDSISIAPNQFEASKILDRVSIQNDSNYLDATFTVSRQQLTEWFENDKISSVTRK